MQSRFGWLRLAPAGSDWVGGRIFFGYAGDETTRVKICCLASHDEATLAVEHGGAALGLVSAMLQRSRP